MFVDTDMRGQGEPYEWPEKVPTPGFLDAPAIGFVAVIYLTAGIILAIKYSVFLGAVLILVGLIVALAALLQLGMWMETT